MKVMSFWSKSLQHRKYCSWWNLLKCKNLLGEILKEILREIFRHVKTSMEKSWYPPSSCTGCHWQICWSPPVQYKFSNMFSSPIQSRKYVHKSKLVLKYVLKSNTNSQIVSLCKTNFQIYSPVQYKFSNSFTVQYKFSNRFTSPIQILK